MTNATQPRPVIWTVLIVRSGNAERFSGPFTILRYFQAETEERARGTAHYFNREALRWADRDTFAVAVPFTEAHELIALYR